MDASNLDFGLDCFDVVTYLQLDGDPASQLDPTMEATRLSHSTFEEGNLQENKR